AVSVRSGMAAPSFEQLAAERYISLVTFRRNGNGVPTPIWVAAADGKLYAVTNGTSVKMKRLKADDKVRLAACDARGNVRGEWVDGHAKRVEDPARSISAGSSTRFAWPSTHSPRTLPRASQAASRTLSSALSRFILTDVPLVTAYSLPSAAATQIGVGTPLPLRRNVTRLM